MLKDCQHENVLESSSNNGRPTYLPVAKSLMMGRHVGTFKVACTRPWSYVSKAGGEILSHVKPSLN